MNPKRPSQRHYSRIIECRYPSGHRQVWYEIRLESPPTRLYESETFSPGGDSLEFRILSHGQLQRTLKRLRRSGGTVTVRRCAPHRPDAGPIPADL